MIQKTVAFSLRSPGVILSSALGIFFAGLYAYTQLDIEAYPNPVPPLVEVIAQPSGWGAEEVERYITSPLEVGLLGMEGLDHIRSQSLFGLSDVKLYFSWGIDYWNARQEVINRLQFIRLPNDISASISPWNAIGEVFRYTVDGSNYSIQERKIIQDWVLERQFRRVPGVIDVVGFGGTTKEIHVEINPHLLWAYGLTLDQVNKAIASANSNVGGQRLTLGEQSYDIRGLGVFSHLQDIENVVVSELNGVPVQIRQLGTVSEGHAPRLGMVGHDDDPDIVQGTVLMRYGGKAPSTLKEIYKRLQNIRAEHALPPGLTIKPYYDRGELAKLTEHTVIENALTGIVLVTVVLYFFLGHLKAALLTALNIPLALLIAFIGLVATHTSANLISIGAVDFGIVVDSTVIMLENIFRHLGQHGRGDIADRIKTAASEISRPLAFSTAIIAISFLPLFTMTGVSGVIFAPMARTYAIAIGGAIILALTLTPVLVSYFVSVDFIEKDNKLLNFLHRLYEPFFDLALNYPRISFCLRTLPMILGILLFPLLGREFMPKLEEGNLWIRANLPVSISFEKAVSSASRMRRIVRGCPEDPNILCSEENRRYPEITMAHSQLGRPDDGTDVTGYYNIELFCPLKDRSQFRRGVTKDKIVEQLSEELKEAFPGVVFNFSQMIRDNVEEAISGVKGENSIKVFGPDIVENKQIAENIIDIIKEVPGITDLGLLPTLGQPGLRISADRQACARYGLNTGDIENVVAAAIGGQVVSQFYEGERFFDITVRFPEDKRQSVEAISRIPINTLQNQPIPLSHLATITIEDSPVTIYRENSQRYAPIKFSVRDRDLSSAINEAQETISKKIALPYDVHLEWSGEIDELKKSQMRLLLIIPLSLLLISLMVRIAVKNWLDTMIVLSDVPVACTGGIIALLLTGQNFSISAAMGFVSVFGIAIQDAILVVNYFQRLHLLEGHDIIHAAREAAEKRFRPVLMTTLVATIGLMPAAFSTAIGAQTQRPLAIVVIGGSLTVAFLTRILQPTMLVLAYRWRQKV